MKPDSIRCFVAIEIPDRIQAILSEVQSDFRSRIKKASWTRNGNFHMTLRFIGDVETTQIQEIDETLQKAVNFLKPFSIEIGGIGTFPNLSRPRVLWVGLTQGVREVTTLSKRINRELAKLGFQKDSRFHPHFTLARLKEQVNMRTYTKLFNKHETIEGTVMNANHITLVRSELHPSGAVYTPINIYHLGREKSNNGE